MSKHTPGPWRIVDRAVEEGSVYPRHIIGGKTELQVCLMESPAAADAYVNSTEWRQFANTEMAQANARLIAAAPDLLSNLVQLCELMESIGHDCTPAREAIAKATGEQT